MSGMKLSITHTEMFVDDQQKALEFYTDVLGMRPHTDVDLGGMRWLTVTPPDQPEVQITLSPLAMGGERTPEDIAALTEHMAKGTLNALIFGSSDVDAAFERVRASGVDIIQEPIDQAYGVRDCAFRDPAGNHLRISQSLGG